MKSCNFLPNVIDGYVGSEVIVDLFYTVYLQFGFKDGLSTTMCTSMVKQN